MHFETTVEAVMTRTRVATMLIVAGLVAGPGRAAAQTPTAASSQAVIVEVAAEGVTQEIELRDGTTAVGRVTGVEGDRLTFVTRGGATLTLLVADVTALSMVEGRDVAGQFWKDDPNPTRLFFGPTGRPLDKGDAYLGVYEIFMPFVQVGVTDRFSVGAGTPLIFGGGGERPFWFTPKYTLVARPRTQAAIGVMHLANVDGDNLGIAYGAVTQGSRDSAVTVGVGFAYDRFEEASAPIVMLGGEHRVHQRLKLVTENYIFEGGGIASGGVRFMTGRLSADLGLASPLGVDEFFVFPMVNFVWTFR
jgi:hypothetical protein